MKYQQLCLASISLAALGGFAVMANAQGKTTGPIANYLMTAETDGGMSALTGGGASAQHRLNLYLSSTRKAADGKGQADHLPPMVLNAGKPLPLRHKESAFGGMNTGLEGFEGKIKFYWGCGEKAGAGQPAVIDLAKLNTKAPPAGMTGLEFKQLRRPEMVSSASSGKWPSETAKPLPAKSSLVGEHVVKGNYSPEIRFALNQSQDFMAPLVLTQNERLGSGAIQLAWQPISNAKAYFGFLMGRSQDDTTIMWTSSNVKTLIGSAGDFMDAGEIARLIGQKALMGPQQTRCAVPAEVVSAAGEDTFFHLTAYGPEANFSYPPKPAGNVPWNIEWTAKLVTKSSHRGILGTSAEELFGDDDADTGDDVEMDMDEVEEQPKKKKKGFGSILKRVL